MSEPPELDRGRAAYAARAWGEAHRLLSAADQAAGLAPGDLWLLAMAAYLIGREQEFLSVLERAHHVHQEAGEAVAAARCAFWIGFSLASRGEVGPGTGWLGRVRRLLASETEPCVEQGYLLIPTAHQQFAAGANEAAFETAGEAVEVAQRFRDGDLLALALHLQGRSLLRQGRVEEGLALLDEAMVGVASDELSPLVTGLVYCSVISACRDAYALRRAQEWTAALSDWCERQPDLKPYRGQCRVHRSEILQLRGAWREAIEEASRVSEGEDSTVERAALSAALYQQGEAHRLLGELAAAEEAYRAASRLGREPQPGLALLRLAQGEGSAAVAALRTAMGGSSDPIRRARLLPALVEVTLATGAHDEAAEACEELAAVADVLRSDFLESEAHHAQGAVALARGDADAAVPQLRRAQAGWRIAGAPYQEARARELLARACSVLGDDEGAALELEAARAAYERLAATPDLARLDTAPYRGSGSEDHGLTPREREVLALVATGKTNRAIATELFISERTVARHVSNIFSKLGLSSRAAATAYAWKHDLQRPPA